MPRATGISASFTDAGVTVSASTNLYVRGPSPEVVAVQNVQFGEGTSYTDWVTSGSNWGGYSAGPDSFFILSGTNLDQILDARLIPRGSSSAEPSGSATGDPLQIGGALLDPTSGSIPDMCVLLTSPAQGYLYFDPDTWFEISVYSIEGGWFDTGIIFSNTGLGLNYYRGMYIFQLNQYTLYPGIPVDFLGYGLLNITSVDVSGVNGIVTVAATAIDNGTGSIAALPDVGQGPITLTPYDGVTTATPYYAYMTYDSVSPTKWNSVAIWQPGDLPASATAYNGVAGADGVIYPGHNWITFDVGYDRNEYLVNFNGPLGSTTTPQYSSSVAASIDTGLVGPFPSINGARNLVLADGGAFPSSYALSFNYANAMYSIPSLSLPKVTSIVRGTGSGLFGMYSLWIHGTNLDAFATSTVPGNPANWIWVGLPDPGYSGYTWYAGIIDVTPTLIKAEWGALGSWITYTERDAWLQIWSYGYDCAGYDPAGNPVQGKERFQYLRAYDGNTWNQTPPPYNNYDRVFSLYVGLHLSQSYGNLTLFQAAH